MPRGNTTLLPGDHVCIALEDRLKPLIDCLFDPFAEAPRLPSGLELSFAAQSSLPQMSRFFDTACYVDDKDATVSPQTIPANGGLGCFGPFVVSGRRDSDVVTLSHGTQDVEPSSRITHRSLRNPPLSPYLFSLAQFSCYVLNTPVQSDTGLISEQSAEPSGLPRTMINIGRDGMNGDLALPAEQEKWYVLPFTDCFDFTGLLFFQPYLVRERPRLPGSMGVPAASRTVRIVVRRRAGDTCMRTMARGRPVPVYRSKRNLR